MDTNQQNMGLLQLDHLVLHDHLLPFLGVNDLLRLRRVCAELKILAEDFIQNTKIKSGREMVSNFSYFDKHGIDVENTEFFEKFTTGLPIRYRLRISSNDSTKETSLYSNSAQLFYTNFGNQITHLSIGRLGMPFGSKKIFRFFEQFPNIRHLVLVEVRPWIDWGEVTELKNDAEVEVPSNLSKLESFSVKWLSVYGPFEEINKSFRFIAKIVEKCLENLKSLFLQFPQLVWNCDTELVIDLACRCLFSENTRLKISNFDEKFIEVLLNPPTLLRVMRTRDCMVRAINEKVISIKNPSLQSFALELPNLEKLHFKTTIEEYAHPIDLCSRWPSVTEIIVSAKSQDELWGNGDSPEVKRSQVWKNLFGGDFCWERLSKLEISIIDSWDNIESYPDTSNIARSCKNLKSIEIRYWTNRHVDLAKLWEGLPLLEEVRFEYCFGMGDEAFFGESEEEPAFLKLKNLKTLEMRTMQDMYDITDAFFSGILRHMPLKELVLSSKDTIDKRDLVKWMNSLLSGRFAETIEKLNMDNLQVNWRGKKEKQEFDKLKRRFRSFWMV